MSWDITLVKTETNTEDYFEITDAAIVPFKRDFVIDILVNNCNGIDCSDETWCIYDCDDYAFEVSFFDENEITLHVHLFDGGEERFMLLLKSLWAFITPSTNFLKISAPIFDNSPDTPVRICFCISAIKYIRKLLP